MKLLSARYSKSSFPLMFWCAYPSSYLIYFVLCQLNSLSEETGIKCAFKSVLAVRHTHKQQFGRSDLYFICKLEPISDEDVPVPQEGEIEAVSWLPLDEYRKMVHSKDSNIGHPMMSRVMDVVDSSSEIERMIVPSIVPGRKHSPLYHAPIGSSE